MLFPICFLFLSVSPHSCFFALEAAVPSRGQFSNTWRNWLHCTPQRHQHQLLALPPKRPGLQHRRTLPPNSETLAPTEQHRLCFSLQGLFFKFLHFNNSNLFVCIGTRGDSTFLQLLPSITLYPITPKRTGSK